MMSISVRFFEQADAEGILGIYRKAGMWFEDINIGKGFIVSSAERTDFRFLVAQEGLEVVGFIGCLYFESVGRAELGPIGVEPKFRGAGVGKALAAGMLSFLSERGIRRVSVKVKAANGGALSFFLGLGFRHEAYLREYTLAGEDVTQLVLHLA